MVDRRFLSVKPAPEPLPVLLIPGFMAGDASLTFVAGWLRRRGHAQVSVAVTYTPLGGSPSTKTTSLKLQLRR